MRRIWIFRLLLAGVLALVVAGTLSGHDTRLGSLAITPHDKLTHFGAYGLIVLLAVPAFPRLSLIWLAAGAATLGLLLELAQGYTGREVSAADVLFNCAGIAAGIAPFALSRLQRKRARAGARGHAARSPARSGGSHE